MMQRISASLLLRVGLAFTLFYVALGSFVEPINWIGFFPEFLFRLGISEGLVLIGFSLYEVILGLWLLSGKKVVYPALLSALTFFGIVVVNLGAMDIVFRDAGLFFAALALAKLSR
ncbi:hypothetical protein IIB97_01430 [Patescibacteria group bacterium]|nr:hypothetical protein [Patescibacteria group bacterium]